MISPQFSSWRRVKVYWSVEACKTFPPCVKELSLKQVGVNSCEPFMSLADIYSPHIPPHPTLAQVWGRIVLSKRFQAWKQPQSHFWHQQLAMIAMTLSHLREKGGNKSSLQRLRDGKTPENVARKNPHRNWGKKNLRNKLSWFHFSIDVNSTNRAPFKHIHIALALC